MKLKWKYIKYILITIIVLIIYILNTIYYFEIITFENLLKNFINAYNYLLDKLEYIFKILIDSISQPEVMSIIFIGIIVKIILKECNRLDILKNITNIEFKDFKVSKEKVEKIEENTIKNERKLEEEEIQNKNIENEIERSIIDSPFLASIIDMYLTEKGKVSINLNIIPEKITLSEISKIFQYKLKANKIEIIKIHSDKESLVVDVFNRLRDKGIIYVEN